MNEARRAMGEYCKPTLKKIKQDSGFGEIKDEKTLALRWKKIEGAVDYFHS
jgi:hypothetical protein